MIRRILNADQNADNVLKLNAGETGCCGDTITDCAYEISYGESNTAQSLLVTEGDTNKVLTLTPGGTSVAQVKAAIQAALTAAGYEEDTEGLDGIEVSDAGANTTVVLRGNIVVVSLTHSGGTASATEKCLKETRCDYALTGFAGGASGSAACQMNINGLAGASLNLGTVTPGTTTAGAVATAVNNALAAAGVEGVASVTTTGTGGSQTYNITISGSEQRNTILLGGIFFSRSNCALGYF